MQNVISKSILFYMCKVPLLNSLTLLLLLGELAKRHSAPPFPMPYIYAHIFVSFVAGLLISNNLLKKDCLLLFVIFYSHLAYLFGTYSEELRYRTWIIQKIFIKSCGCIGSFLILSSHLTGYSCLQKFQNTDGKHYISYTGQCLLGIYAICSCHNLFYSKEVSILVLFDLILDRVLFIDCH